MAEPKIRHFLLFIRMARNDRNLGKTLREIDKSLEHLSVAKSAPIFNHPDGYELALIIHSHLSATQISNGLYHGSEQTNEESCLDSKDTILVLPISDSINWSAIGFNRIYSLLPERHFPKDPHLRT